MGVTSSSSYLDKIHSCSELSLLPSVLEGSDELGNVVIISLLFLASVELSELGLEVLVLLGTDLLEDVRHHVFKLLGLGVAGNDKEVLSDGELSFGSS